VSGTRSEAPDRRAFFLNPVNGSYDGWTSNLNLTYKFWASRRRPEAGPEQAAQRMEHLIHFSGTKRSSRLMRVRATADVSTPEMVGTEFLTRSEVSKLLGVSPNTVTRWAREGRLPCQVTLGGHHRFDRELVEQLRKSLYRAASRID